MSVAQILSMGVDARLQGVRKEINSLLRRLITKKEEKEGTNRLGVYESFSPHVR